MAYISGLVFTVVSSSTGRSLDKKLALGVLVLTNFSHFFQRWKCVQARKIDHKFETLIEYKRSLMKPTCDIREGQSALIVKWKGLLKGLNLSVNNPGSEDSTPSTWSKIVFWTERLYYKAALCTCSLKPNYSKLANSEDMCVPKKTSKPWCRAQGTQCKVFPSLKKQCSAKPVRIQFSPHTRKVSMGLAGKCV